VSSFNSTLSFPVFQNKQPIWDIYSHFHRHMKIGVNYINKMTTLIVP
jgi:hypothetical protein